MSQLYILATPIGNLEDITLRGLRILRECDLVIAEDARHTSILLKHYDIQVPKLISWHAQSSPAKLQQIIREIAQVQTAVYASDCGTPGISDPGVRLVSEATKTDITITPLPGASAMTALLSVAGYPIAPCIFHGFLPHKKGRQTAVQSIAAARDSSHLLYESVHRIHKLLEELSAALGHDRPLVIGREMTKIHEEFFRGTIAQAQAHLQGEKCKGEFAVFVPAESFVRKKQKHEEL